MCKIVLPSKSLLFLSLKNNKLRNIEDNSFVSLSQLVELDLENNNINSINNLILRGLNFVKSLRIINLRKNPILEIDSYFVSQINYLNYLFLENSYFIQALKNTTKNIVI